MAPDETEIESDRHAPRVLVVAAHPDDETIGCGGLLLGLSGRARAYVVHVTDGAPRDRRFVPQGVEASREGYASIRRAEVIKALSLAAIGKERLYSLGAIDQEASFELVRLVRALAELLLEIRPDFVVSHAYEGGHPDHDAASFVTHGAFASAAPRLLRAVLVEMSSYHGEPGHLVTGRFLQRGDSQPPIDTRSAIEALTSLRGEDHDGIEIRFSLSPRLSEKKRSMLRCFETQRDILAPFGIESEMLRRAPRHDFSRPPHAGPLHYERLGWPMTGLRFRRRIEEARRELWP